MAIIFGSPSSKRSMETARAVKAGKLRKIGSKLYTDDLTAPLSDIVRRHRFEIVAHFYPGSVISHRSAIEGGVSPKGKLHVTSPRAVKPMRMLPGLEIRLWKGPPAQPTDIRTVSSPGDDLFTSSQARALLENLQVARARGEDEPKILSRAELERWVDRQVRVFGMSWLDQTQAQAAALASSLGWKREIVEFDGMVDAFKGLKTWYRLTTDIAQARAKGTPFDPDRITLFQTLQARLAAERFVALRQPPSSELANRAFWEAYFSNYIEGTKFTVEEAQAIVHDGFAAKELEHKRPEDAHDVRETYRLIVDPKISAELPGSTAHLLELLKRRHARLMATRANVEPGVFKNRRNEFGSRVFVAPELVQETLARGWPAARDLPTAAGRAIYMLFLISEVHPFVDGNGRISRLCMNAEMEASKQARLIIPISLRADYLGVLEALTVRGDPGPFISFAHKLIDLNSRMPFGSFDETHNYFRRSGALEESFQPFNWTPILPQV